MKQHPCKARHRISGRLQKFKAWDERVSRQAFLALRRTVRKATGILHGVAQNWEKAFLPSEESESDQQQLGGMESGKEGPLFVVDSWLLEDVARHLTPGQDEEICYLTGPIHEGGRHVSRILGLTLDKQNMVRAWANPKSCSDTLIEMVERGFKLHVMAHSHPGSGAIATTPSSIDTAYLGKVQRNGADTIGLIVTRDGHARFFTVEKPFQIRVVGEQVQKVEEYVYKIEIQKNDSNQAA